MNYRRLILLTMAILCWAYTSRAGAERRDQKQNTFVGNGGNAGDLELQLTLGQLQRALDALAIDTTTTSDQLCVCADAYDGRAICEPLEALNEAQKKYCAGTLKAKGVEIRQVLSAQGGLKFDWSEKTMQVDEDGGYREADAVADTKNNRIILNRSNFVSLQMSERVFLLTHELMHFTKVNGEPMVDVKPVGPFTERDGGRRLLNAYGAALAMYAYNQKVYEQDIDTNKRSKNYMRHWFLVNVGQRSADKKSTFALEEVQGVTLEYRAHFRSLLPSSMGTFFRGRIQNEEEDRLTSTTVSTKQSGLSTGFSLQIMPFSDPMTTMGQSYFIFSVGVESMTVDYVLDDNITKQTDDARSVAGLARLQYFFPLVNGFWVDAEIAVTNHDYELKDVSVKSTSMQSEYYLGVAYGF